MRAVVLDTLETSENGGYSKNNKGTKRGAVVAMAIDLPGKRCPVFIITTFRFFPGVSPG